VRHRFLLIKLDISLTSRLRKQSACALQRFKIKPFRRQLPAFRTSIANLFCSFP